MDRASGILMHISSLWGDYSCGSFGAAAKEFVDFLKICGFSYWQVLPFCMTDAHGSPYKSYSAFGGNPYFIDIDTLFEKGLITADERDGQRQLSPYACEFDRLSRLRLPLLRKAAARVADKNGVEAFVSAHPPLLQAAEFMALKTANGFRPWNEWTVAEPDRDELFFWKFIQHEFFCEWQEIKQYAESAGISVIGDIPIYVDHDSSDVFANRSLFDLGADNRPRNVAGVPPDYFSADGQLWGNPLYDWDAMRADGYAWWLSRVEYMLELFDGVRIDHFRGLESYWSVPAGAATAREGKWMKGPGREFIDVLRRTAGDKLIIAEDLGDITHEVRKLVEYSGFPGMRVLQFSMLGGDNPHLPHNYVNNCVAYTGTHDNNTLLGYVWELDDASRRRLTEYCGYLADDWDKSYGQIIRTMFASAAGLVILPVQDILGYGADTRLNTPGRAEGNWTFRLKKEQLYTVNREYYRHLNRLYER